MFQTRIGMDPHHFLWGNPDPESDQLRLKNPDPDAHQGQFSGSVKVQNGAIEGSGRSQWRCRGSKWCRVGLYAIVVADEHHFYWGAGSGSVSPSKWKVGSRSEFIESELFILRRRGTKDRSYVLLILRGGWSMYCTVLGIVVWRKPFIFRVQHWWNISASLPRTSLPHSSASSSSMRLCTNSIR